MGAEVAPSMDMYVQYERLQWMCSSSLTFVSSNQYMSAMSLSFVILSSVSLFVYPTLRLNRDHDMLIGCNHPRRCLDGC